MASETVPPDRFRGLMSCFPTGVAVVASLSADGRPQGMTCSSLSSVCLDPPTLLVCVRTGSLTYQAVTWRREFSVNLLREDGQAAAEVFASLVPDRFSKVDWKLTPRGLPWLVDDARTVADCRVVSEVPIGDHTVVFGQVTEITAGAGGEPLLYGDRHYGRWQSAAPSPWPADSTRGR